MDVFAVLALIVGFILFNKREPPVNPKPNDPSGPFGADFQCLFIWLPPFDPDGLPARQVGQLVNLDIDIRGLPPSEVFDVVNYLERPEHFNEHPPNTEVARGTFRTDDDGTFKRRDRVNRVPLTYQPGVYRTEIEIRGQTRECNPRFHVVLAGDSGFPPPPPPSGGGPGNGGGDGSPGGNGGLDPGDCTIFDCPAPAN